MQEISKSEAVELGLKRFFTGRECPKGHISERYVCDGKCCECIGERQRERNKSKEFRDRKNRRMRDSGYLGKYAREHYRKSREAEGKKVVPKPEWKKKGMTPWARAKKNAARRVREAIISQVSCHVGIHAAELKIYIENKFQRGMSWENYGEVWEMDHIRPLADFDLTNPEDLKQAVHYTNLQPLFVEDNATKLDEVPEGHQDELAMGFSHSMS